jgi:nitroreductase
VVRVEVIEHAPEKLFKGVVGGYGRVIKAPSAFLVIGREQQPAVQESMGYLGEAMVVQATALGLGTCWIGGFFDRDIASELTSLTEDERVFAVSPLGYTKERPRRGERLLKAAARSARRRPLDEVAPEFNPARWPEWAAEGVRLARIAPSAANRQPWRFDLAAGGAENEGPADPYRPSQTAGGAGQNTADARGSAEVTAPAGVAAPASVVVSVVDRGVYSTISRLLDVGIAMLHFEVGARSRGATGSWQLLDPPAVARFSVGL